MCKEKAADFLPGGVEEVGAHLGEEGAEEVAPDEGSRRLHPAQGLRGEKGAGPAFLTHHHRKGPVQHLQGPILKEGGDLSHGLRPSFLSVWTGG
jgi:hypothetical protein